ncbi:hypothetical protein B0O99DRAFT_717827 [Bisporella sp. PMI_857]|nr:hypothetical protein B0O99DRAFT_717827 [Bisporella sp. PMI_857]
MPRPYMGNTNIIVSAWVKLKLENFRRACRPEDYSKDEWTDTNMKSALDKHPGREDGDICSANISTETTTTVLTSMTPNKFVGNASAASSPKTFITAQEYGDNTWPPPFEGHLCVANPFVPQGSGDLDITGQISAWAAELRPSASQRTGNNISSRQSSDWASTRRPSSGQRCESAGIGGHGYEDDSSPNRPLSLPVERSPDPKYANSRRHTQVPRSLPPDPIVGKTPASINQDQNDPTVREPSIVQGGVSLTSGIDGEARSITVGEDALTGPSGGLRIRYPGFLQERVVRPPRPEEEHAPAVATDSGSSSDNVSTEIVGRLEISREERQPLGNSSAESKRGSKVPIPSCKTNYNSRHRSANPVSNGYCRSDSRYGSEDVPNVLEQPPRALESDPEDVITLSDDSESSLNWLSGIAELFGTTPGDSGVSAQGDNSRRGSQGIPSLDNDSQSSSDEFADIEPHQEERDAPVFNGRSSDESRCGSEDNHCNPEDNLKTHPALKAQTRGDPGDNSSDSEDRAKDQELVGASSEVN